MKGGDNRGININCKPCIICQGTRKEVKMKRALICLCIMAGSLIFASQRVVVCEEFTATWCTYCPGGARGLDENYERDYDSVVVIAYHSSTSDPFYTAEAATRATYYNLSGYPTTWFDGTISEVGGLHYGTMYPFYRHHITNRLGVSSPLEINLTCNYDSVANTGTVNATIQNTSASAVSGNLHFVIVENNIPYNWQGMTELDFVMRDMLPDANGEAVTIPAGGNINRSRNFTISAGWNENNCKIVVFVQASNRSIYQGAEIGIMAKPHMEYYGLLLNEITGNGNRFAEPGEVVRIDVFGKNLGDGVYTGTAGVQCSDPYITISGATPQSIAIGPGDVDTVIYFNASISSSCPSPHQTSFLLNFGSTIDTIPFVITRTPGFSDNIEYGQGNWVHSGISDNWHITEHKSHSPTHSWYCGVEGSWQYTNENDASLTSPYFVVTPDSNLYFYHQYALETGWDYGYIEIDNGSNWWRTLTEFNGTQSNWIQYSSSLQAYSGQTARIRFRFISDYSTVMEGWYIDDVYIPTLVGISENKGKTAGYGVSLSPNPFSDKLLIKFENGIPSKNTIKIYDHTGRLVWQSDNLNNYSIIWDGKDNNGNKLPSGIYFIEFTSEANRSIHKVVRID